MEPEVIVVLGPTCSGKTALGLLLSKMMKSEIISADSRQVYKCLDIGTAKPSKNELNSVKHHLIDHLDPNAEYSASKFEKDALDIIRCLTANNIMPIVVGGSGLYIKALVDGIFDTVDVDVEFREQMLEDRKSYGNEYIYDQLKKIDPKTASKLLPQNWKRVIRALEVYHITGSPIWTHHNEYERAKEFEFLQFGLRWNRDKLYENIEKRVDEMFSSGLVHEVENLLKKGFDPAINSLNTVGYKEVIDHLNGDISLDRAKELIKRNTRRYAKRQMTWFRKDDRITWYDINSSEELDDIALKIVDLVK